MFEPQNEQGVIVLFAQQTDFEIIEINISYPDAIVKRNDNFYKVEFEYQSSNFLLHKHDPEVCDLIVCWIHDWDECPLPVLELSNSAQIEAEIQPVPLSALINYWKQRALKAEKQLERQAEEIKGILELNRNAQFECICPICKRAFANSKALGAHSRFCKEDK